MSPPKARGWACHRLRRLTGLDRHVLFTSGATGNRRCVPAAARAGALSVEARVVRGADVGVPAVGPHRTPALPWSAPSAERRVRDPRCFRTRFAGRELVPPPGFEPGISALKGPPDP